MLAVSVVALLPVTSQLLALLVALPALDSTAPSLTVDSAWLHHLFSLTESLILLAHVPPTY